MRAEFIGDRRFTFTMDAGLSTLTGKPRSWKHDSVDGILELEVIDVQPPSATEYYPIGMMIPTCGPDVKDPKGIVVPTSRLTEVRREGRKIPAAEFLGEGQEVDWSYSMTMQIRRITG